MRGREKTNMDRGRVGEWKTKYKTKNGTGV